MPHLWSTTTCCVQWPIWDQVQNTHSQHTSKFHLLTHIQTSFLIPNIQTPYKWGEETLSYFCTTFAYHITRASYINVALILYISLPILNYISKEFVILFHLCKKISIFICRHGVISVSKSIEPNLENLLPSNVLISFFLAINNNNRSTYFFI